MFYRSSRRRRLRRGTTPCNRKSTRVKRKRSLPFSHSPHDPAAHCGTHTRQCLRDVMLYTNVQVFYCYYRRASRTRNARASHRKRAKTRAHATAAASAKTFFFFLFSFHNCLQFIGTAPPSSQPSTTGRNVSGSAPRRAHCRAHVIIRYNM